MNLKVPFAKAMHSWETHFKDSLKSLRQKDSSFALQIGFLLPSQTEGPHQELPAGWLMLERDDDPTLNEKSVTETVAGETARR